MKTIDSLGDLRGKRVLVRSDFNVPARTARRHYRRRPRSARPCRRCKRLTDAGARVVVMAHLGRPKGAPDHKYSLAPVAARLGELLGQSTSRSPRTSSATSATATVAALADGEVALLENVRFDARETSKVDAERAELAGELARARPTRSSRTASASCTASRRRCTTSRRCCPPPPATWC